MKFDEKTDLDISKVELAHEFVLDTDHLCSYPQGRGHYGLIFAIDGDANWHFSSGEQCSCKKGQILLLTSRSSYRILTKGAFRHITVNFYVHEKNVSNRQSETPYYLHTPIQTGRYIALFHEIVELWKKRSAGYEMRATAYVYELLSMMAAEQNLKREGAGAYKRLLDAKNYLDEFFAYPISVEELAKRTNMSVTNFRREWKKVFEETAMQYRDRLRIAQAEEYLRSGYFSVTEVAFRVGFDDVSYFVRFFKKHTGMTPKEFQIGYPRI